MGKCFDCQMPRLHVTKGDAVWEGQEHEMKSCKLKDHKWQFAMRFWYTCVPWLQYLRGQVSAQEDASLTETLGLHLFLYKSWMTPP